MQLLTAEQAKTKNNQTEMERAERVRKMNEEESAISKRLNTAREFEAQEKERIEKSVSETRTKAQLEIKSLEGEIASKRQERADLMKPIHDIRNEAEQRLASAKKAETEVELARETLKKSTAELAERVEAIIDREKAAEERDTDLDNRERKVAIKESAVEKSEKSLNEKWVKYHEAVNGSNLDLERREKEVRDGQKANEVVRQSLAAEGIQLSNDRRALRDGYATLERSKTEITTGKRPNTQ